MSIRSDYRDDYHPEVCAAWAIGTVTLAIGAFFSWLLWLTLVQP